jgi:hypothetical protein
MNPRLNILAGSVCGAAALLLVLEVAPIRRAEAQPARCVRWEVTSDASKGESGGGWEPFAVVPRTPGNPVVYYRHCKQH